MSQKTDEQLQEAIALLWEVFQNEAAKGLNRVTAEENAMKAVFPDEENPERLLATWKVRGVWPPEHPVFEHSGLCSDHEEEPPADDFQSMDMPAEWMETILGFVRTTVNAAILDYHNVQGDQVTQEIDHIKSRIAELRLSLENVSAMDKEEITALARTSALDAVREALQERPVYAGISSAQPFPGISKEAADPVTGRQKLETTCSSALLALLHRECTRWGLSVDRMLDHILLDYFRRSPESQLSSRTQKTE